MNKSVGNDLHPTDFARVDDWKVLIKCYISMGTKKIYFFPYEPNNILAPQLADYLCTKINSEIAITTRGPKQINGAKQLNLF